MSQDSKQTFPNIVYGKDQNDTIFRANQMKAEDQGFLSVRTATGVSAVSATTTTIKTTAMMGSGPVVDSRQKMTTTTTTMVTTGSVTPLLKEKEKEKEKEVLKEKEKEAEIWDGPLSRYNTYPSNKTAKQCSQVIEETLVELEKEELVDWEMDGFNVFGRMYHKFDMSEFMMNVYISSDNQYKSVIEIRRSSGDTFVHDEFFRRISKHLQDKQVLEHKEDDHEVDFDLSFELEPFSFDNLNHNDLSQELGSPNSNGVVDHDVNDIISVSSDHTSIEQLATELIEVVTDRWSYREVFRHSSGVLCQELKDNPLFLLFIATQVDILQRLMQPLTENLYDTLILRNILQVVKHLLQHKNPTVSIYDHFAKDIHALKQTWTEGAHHQSINMRFGRSQQVERICSECLQLLEKRS